LRREGLPGIRGPAARQLPAAQQDALPKRYLPREVHAEYLANVKIGKPALQIQIERILSALIAARAGIVQSRIVVDRFAISVVWRGRIGHAGIVYAA